MTTGQKRLWRAIAGGLAFLLLLLLIGSIGSVPELGVTPLGYEDRIFDPDRIHSINILPDDPVGFFEACDRQEVSRCSVVIKEETFPDVAIRALGEQSSNRYSFLLEFDRYDNGRSYYGLDTLELNNLYCDNTMMKDCLTYRLMGQLGVAAPLCSYITVYINGRSLGLYLAVEGMDESFLQRNFGNSHGRLYKPEITDGDAAPDAKLQYLGDEPRHYPHLLNSSITEASEQDQMRLIQALKQLSTGKKLSDSVDIEAVTRFFAVHLFAGGETGYTGTGTYCLYEKEGRLSMLPGDYQTAFGASTAENAHAVINAPIVLSLAEDRYAELPMIQRIFSDRNYLWLYQRYQMELLNIDMEAMVEQTRKAISPYVLRDPTRFCTYEEFEAGADTLEEFLELRSESVQRQLLGNPEPVDPGDLDLSTMGIVTPPTHNQTAR